MVNSVVNAGQRRVVTLSTDIVPHAQHTRRTGFMILASLFHVGMRVIGPCLVVLALSLKGRILSVKLHVF